MKKVYCLHPNIRSVKDLIHYLGISETMTLSDLAWNPQRPDYLFVTEHIYLNMKFFSEFNHYIQDEKIIKIFLAGECISPDMNIFDYAIVFDRELKDLDRIQRFPPTILHHRSILRSTNNLNNEDTARELLQKKQKFCCFLYSNRNAHPMRDTLFYEISKYKPVDSLGKHLHNTETPPSRTNEDWRELSINLKSLYKFSIASENASYEGYTSEKLFSSFQAHTIPIYWGNPFVSEEYNEDAFIDCNKYKTIEEIVEKIREIDMNDELWCHMISQPWQKEEQSKKTVEEIKEYYKFIEHIFTQNINDAHRIPNGTYPERYREFFVRGKGFLFMKYSKIGKIWEVLRHGK